MTQLIWLTIALPVIGLLFNGILGRRAGYRVVRVVGPLVVGLAFLVGLGAMFETLARDGEPVTVHLWTWAAIGDFEVPINLLVDPLSVLMVLVVTGVGFLIHVYATEYMIHTGSDGHAHPDRDYTRFFTFLNLFIASMLVLVLGDNYLMMYVGWELVGVSSYLLIGFWFDRPAQEQDPVDLGDGVEPVKLTPLLSPAASGMKAFIVNRIGDVGFALGVFLIWSTFGTLQFDEVFARAEEINSALPTVIPWITALLFVGAIGKSAQLPLYVWLPDAMAGPTPVSALIHAATMVTAGVYMIVRSNALYSLAPGVSNTIAVIGMATAFFAATIALVQTDLKRVLAYSTISQLGYMFSAVGVGAYTAGMFHLTTHAFFKALLFLGAGSVMHALHDVIDLRRMGGLKDKMKITWITFWVGSLALAGFPLMSGFFSKDEILAKDFEVSPLLWFVGVVTAGLTAFYTFRAVFLAFHGAPRDRHLHDHAHESGRPITFALGVLAVLALFGGLLGLPTWLGLPHVLENNLEPVYEYMHHADEHHLSLALEATLMAISALTAIGGIVVAYVFYIVNPAIPRNIARASRGLFNLLANKYWVDEIYNAAIVQPALQLARAMSGGIDKGLIDNVLVDGTARAIGRVGRSMSRLQDGYVGHYALATFIGVLVIVSYFFLR
ncbi:MAG: NADH-quinone oxidoreductase subunit L [Chloroflexi bacterium]|nr:MAG: NADH-quinone oxidoreductase subunit L [Chloroflexota bacterium]